MQNVHIAYVGFVSLPTAREYTLRLTEPDGSSHDFKLAVANAAFLSRHVRYQDGPEICFQKLQRAVIACEQGLPALRQHVTDEDLAAYRVSHSPKVSGRRSTGS